MTRVIESVEVIHNHPEGPDFYKVGNKINFGKDTIADIIEINGVFYFYNENEELIMEIRNCPVVVKYKEEGEGK